MDLRQLEIVQAVAETGSFTGAGRKLHVSQSAISRQILLLEDELQEPLFLRNGRRIRITPAGDALLSLSRRVFTDVKETVTLIGESQQMLTGNLRLAGGMTVCLYVFPVLLKEFRRLHPKVDVKLITGSSQRLLQELRSGSADLGFLTLPVNEPDIIAVPAMEEELLVVTHPSHPLAKNRRIVSHDLVRQPFVLFESGSNTRRLIDEFFVKEMIQPEIVMETENVEILKALVRTEIGITIIPYEAVAREVRSGQLFCSRIAGISLVRQTGWIFQRSNRVPRTFEEMFRTFQRIRPRLKVAPDLKKA
ncbi:MAG: LysR family transcriptional regulator [Acidobacteria bacterium]|jgi:DNA-binding transcriptional LysR family regulator|nr:MAG: LysR family transcriptional regulator [Acidobacteriota bacterium]